MENYLVGIFGVLIIICLVLAYLILGYLLIRWTVGNRFSWREEAERKLHSLTWGVIDSLCDDKQKDRIKKEIFHHLGCYALVENIYGKNWKKDVAVQSFVSWLADKISQSDSTQPIKSQVSAITIAWRKEWWPDRRHYRAFKGLKTFFNECPCSFAQDCMFNF